VMSDIYSFPKTFYNPTPCRMKFVIVHSSNPGQVVHTPRISPLMPVAGLSL